MGGGSSGGCNSQQQQRGQLRRATRMQPTHAEDIRAPNLEKLGNEGVAKMVEMP